MNQTIKPCGNYQLFLRKKRMRYGKDHRENTNKRITDLASRRFRKEGIHAVGIVGLMADADLTRGGFYSHFKSKEELVIKAVSNALEETLARLESYAEENNGGIEALVTAYLQPIHRETPENGCAIAAIGPELSKLPNESQQIISEFIERFFALIEKYLPRTGLPEKRHQTAMAIVALLVGAIQISRMMSGKKQKDEVLKNGIDAALALATCWESLPYPYSMQYARITGEELKNVLDDR